MNGTEKGSFTLNQASAGEVDLGTVITAHQDISGKVDKTTLLNTLMAVDLSSNDIAVRKVKLDQFEADWKALTGAGNLNGARFVGFFKYHGMPVSCLFIYGMGMRYGGVFTINDGDDNFYTYMAAIEYDELGARIRVTPAVEIATIAEIDNLFVINTGSI